MIARLTMILILLPGLIFGQYLPTTEAGTKLWLVQDTNKIDHISQLARKAIELSKRDSAFYYARSAYESSLELHFSGGTARALSLLGFAESFFYCNLLKAESCHKAAISFFEKTANQNGFGECLDKLAFVCFAQSKYDEAVRYATAAYKIYKRDSDDTGISSVLQLFTQIYLKRGNFDKAFDAGQQALLLNEKRNNRSEIKGCWLGLGSVCMGIESYALALEYYRKVFAHFTAEDSIRLMNSEDLVWAKMEYAEIYSHLGQFDSALYRYSFFDSTGSPEKDTRIFLVSQGEFFLLQGQYRTALPALLRGLAIHTRLNDGNEIVRTTLDIAQAYFGLHQSDSALGYARTGLSLGAKSAAPQRIRDAYKLLYLVFEKRNQADSAFHYYKKYVQTKELLTDDQTKGKFAAQQYLSKITLLNSDRATNQQRLKFQDQLLKKQSVMRDILIALFFVVVIVSMLLIRNILLKRKNDSLTNESTRRELIHRTNEMEMQALRAQMNPHFIFNCLNSINRFIMKNASQEASDYLTRFSRLIRMVLNNSKRAWISLEEETDMLRLYFEMEKLRFKDSFDYAISFQDGVEAGSLFIPPLLLQPFVENAIWHGLMHKEEHGLVSVSFQVADDTLICLIEDNGIGRSAAAKTNSKSSQVHKSLGLRITGERLALINRQSESENVSYTIEDLIDGSGHPSGTRVCLKLKVRVSVPIHEGINPNTNFIPV